MSKKLRKTFSRPESDKTETDIKKEPVEASAEIPSEGTIEHAMKNELEGFTEKPVTKTSKPSKKSKPTEVEAKVEPDIEQKVKSEVEPKEDDKSAVDVGHIELVEKKSSKKERKLATLKKELAIQEKVLEKGETELKMLKKQSAKKEKEVANQRAEFEALSLQAGIHGQKSVGFKTSLQRPDFLRNQTRAEY